SCAILAPKPAPVRGFERLRGSSGVTLVKTERAANDPFLDDYSLARAGRRDVIGDALAGGAAAFGFGVGSIGAGAWIRGGIALFMFQDGLGILRRLRVVGRTVVSVVPRRALPGRIMGVAAASRPGGGCEQAGKGYSQHVLGFH